MFAPSDPYKVTNSEGTSRRRFLSGRPKISLCMIVKNEEKDLAACVESARGAFDELIIVDTGSTDDTKNAAAALGAKLINYTWNDDFAAARNCSLEAATGDFILILDADERLTKGSPSVIRESLTNPNTAALAIEVLSDVGGGARHGAWLVRLFPRSAEIRYIRRLHESVNEAIAQYHIQHGTRTLFCDAKIEHSGYTPSRFESLQKRERNLKLHKLTVEERPGDAYAWYRYGDELRAVDKAKAAEALERSWSLLLQMPAADRMAQVYGAEVPVVLAFLMLEKGDAAGARELLLEASGRVKCTPNFIYGRALANLQLERWQEALEDFKTLRSLDGERILAPIQPGITNIIACVRSAQCYEKLGDLAAAKLHHSEALAIDPTCQTSALALAQLLQKNGEGDEARRVLDRYIQHCPKDAKAWALSGTLALEAGAPRLAVKRLGVAATAPGTPEAVWIDLALAHALAGDLESAMATVAKIESPGGRALLQQKMAAARPSSSKEL